ncbi:MAG: spore maturation protein [Clostridia bacterium]|nr:spore maturation protein [Clostridia bacterium]
MISAYIIPVLIIAILIYARVKKIETYNVFVKGAKGAFDLVLSIFPFIVTIMIMVALMRASGLMDIIISVLAPAFGVLGIPIEVSELVLLRPFTGSGSYAILNDIYETYGVDTYISRCASVIMGTSETIFYVAAVYFSQTSVKKLSYAIPLALVLSLFGTIVACLICKIL